MADEPSYPDDAPVDGPPESEASRSAAAVKAVKTPAGGRKNLITGAAIGIGSAALVAALLYANRARKSGDRES